MTAGPLDYAKPHDAPDGNGWGWAAYLGASWTWCIGMYLPVLLIRDYGPWAWVVFAVPNVVGAAAMGWVMRSRDASRRYVADHASACRLFSYVTLAFQLFFATWMLPRLVGPAGYAGAALIVQSAFTPVVRSKWLRLGGAGAIVVSLIAFGVMNAERPLIWPESARSMNVGELLGLSAVCLAGFVLCPYLDLTFHRARIETENGPARFAFGVGFGVLFLSMIVLTFFYATDLRRVGLSIYGNLPESARIALALHFIVQMTYTAHAHAAELKRQAETRNDRGVMIGGLGLWLAIGFAAGLWAANAGGHETDRFGSSVGETLYRGFMAFYGLLSPAYVLLAFRGRPAWWAWLSACALSAPFYFGAFFLGEMGWAVLGVTLLALSVVIVRQVIRPATDLPIARSE